MPAQGLGQKADGEVPGFDAGASRPWRADGTGLHTGRACALTLAPAARGAGWRLNGAPVAALTVLDTRLCTSLQTPSGPVATVEHLFAALAGMGVADVEVGVEGGEVPAFDGSAAPLCHGVRAARLERPGLPGRPLLRPVRVACGGATLEARPADAFTLVVEADFPGLVSGTFTFEPSGGDDFERDLAPARTFGRVADADALRAAGRALGASLSTCLVFDDAGMPLNPGGLRFPEEPIRHKALDLLGDLARLGWLPRAVVRASRAGHTSHAALVSALIAACDGPSP